MSDKIIRPVLSTSVPALYTADDVAWAAFYAPKEVKDFYRVKKS